MNIRKRVYINQTDIHRGIIGDPCKCPVARSLRRYIKEAYSIYVTTGNTFFRLGEKTVCSVPTPQAALDLIEAFDNFHPTSPVRVDFYLPEELFKTGGVR